TVMSDLRARSQMRVIAGVAARVLSPADQLLHVCGHAASCASRDSLRWVCDARLLIEQHPDLDWGVLSDCARRGQLALPLFIILRYLAEELRTSVPPALLERLSGVASRAGTVEREVALQGARAGTRGRLKTLLGMSAGWRSRVFVLKWIVLP